MNKRALVKWLHWLSFAMMLYFLIDEPELSDRGAIRADEISFHAGMGLILACLTFMWFLLYAVGGPLGRPGPKLPAWGKRAHKILNTGLYWGVPAMVFTGGLAGLCANFPVRAFGMIPLSPAGWGSEFLHDIAEEIHEIAFDLLIILIVAHGAFHVWRHLWLRDNSLRIMVPKALHRYL